MSHVTHLTTYLKLMVTNLTAVKVTIPTIKIIMKVTKKTLSTKPISTSLTLLKIKLMGDGILVPWPWNLHLVVKIEPKTLFVCDRNSQNSWRIPIPSAQLTKTIHQRWNKDGMQQNETSAEFQSHLLSPVKFRWEFRFLLIRTRNISKIKCSKMKHQRNSLRIS